MGEERAVATHIEAAEQYLEVAKRLLGMDEHFASVLCAATGLERAAMALILHLGAVPAGRHRHHEVLRTLQSLIGDRERKEFEEAVEAVAELMGHLTMVRYKYELSGEYKTPRELYDRETAQRLFAKARKTVGFAIKFVRKRLNP